VGVFLLDANVLVALAWPEHGSHDRVGRWFARHSRGGWATCPFTESALVRILSNPAFSSDSLSVENAMAVLEANVKLPGHQFWPADTSLVDAIAKIGKRLRAHRQITDAYLVGLAVHHHGKLATMDRSIGSLAPEEAVALIP
jgi:toxin-antitoxin system PIN domain toxin